MITAAKTQFVSTLSEKEAIDSLFLVKDKFSGVGKTGKTYLGFRLSDSTGSVDSRVWERADEMNPLFENGQIVKVRGVVQLFQNRKQVIVHKIEAFAQAGLDLSLFIPQASRAAEDLFVDLLAKVQTVQNLALRTLIQSSLEDPEIKPLLLRSPAAKSIHHATQGGLMEHILSICNIMEFLATHYDFLSRDLLLFGAIFHDIGKVWELRLEQGIQYTDRGKLIGHMEMACELVDRKSKKILGFSDELRDLCKHIILSHHGKLEYGSPKRPKFLEALVVAMVDDMDSKINTVKTFVDSERASGQRWSSFNDLFERYFILDDLKMKIDGGHD